MAWKIGVLRRIFASMPFLTIAFVGFNSLNILFLEEIFSLDVRERAIFTAALAPLSIIGLVIGARISGRLIERAPGLVLRFLALTSVIIGGLAAVYALSIYLTIAFISAALIFIG